MAVKTTKIQCNQDVDVKGKVTCSGDAEVDGCVYTKGRDIAFGRDLQGISGETRGIFIDEDGFLSFGSYFNNFYDYIAIEPLANDITFYFGTRDNFKWVSLSDIYKATKTNYYRHSLTLTCGETKYYADIYANSNTPVTTLDALTRITAGHSFACGTAKAISTSPVTWSIGETAIDSVSDEVAPVVKEI